MKQLIRSFIFVLSIVTLTSATTTKVLPQQQAKEVTNVISSHNTGFFQKVVNLFSRKHKKADPEYGDRQAGISLYLGIGAFVVLLAGGFLSVYLPILAVPLGIFAIITGKSALRNNTNRQGAARTGKILGIVALITIVSAVIIGAIWWASFWSSW